MLSPNLAIPGGDRTFSGWRLGCWSTRSLEGAITVPAALLDPPVNGFTLSDTPDAMDVTIKNYDPRQNF